MIIKWIKSLWVNQHRHCLSTAARKGDGLWFDKGELKNIFDKASLDKENKIQKLLADMFGYQVKMMLKILKT